MFLSALTMFFLILESRSVMEFASVGIDLCIRTVIPSLFPFFLISIYMTGNLSGGSGLFPVLFSGLLGGYPVGAQTVAESFRSGTISEDTANRLLSFCSQAGPAFLFGMVASQFPSPIYALCLWCIQLLSAGSTAFLMGIPHMAAPGKAPAASVSLPRAMQSAIRAMSSVCGWVVVFRVWIGFLSRLPLGGIWKVLISGLLELSNGCMCLGTVESISLRFLLAAVMLNFGGICVLLQTASVIAPLNLRYYLLGKLLQTAFSIGYCLLFSGLWIVSVPIIVTFLLANRQKAAKNSSIPARVGV